MTYFTGKGYGVSTLTDISGRPLLTYQGPRDKKPILLSDRVAVLKDPTIIQKWTLAELYNTRMPLATSASIKKAVGGTATQELDHKIPLELGGSNSISNLRLEDHVPGTANTPTDPIENALSQRVQQGNISLQFAWQAMAQAKGYALGEDSGTGTPITFQSALDAILFALQQKGGGRGGKTSSIVSTDVQAQITQNLAIIKADPLNLNARTALFTAQIAATQQKTGMSPSDAAGNIVAVLKANASAQGNSPGNVNVALGNNGNNIIAANTALDYLHSSAIASMLQTATTVLSSLPAIAIAGIAAIVVVGVAIGPEALAALVGLPILGTIADAFGVSTVAGVAAAGVALTEILAGWAFLFFMGIKQYDDSEIINTTLMATAFKNTGSAAIASAGAPLPPQVYADNTQAAASNAGTNIATATPLFLGGQLVLTPPPSAPTYAPTTPAQPAAPVAVASPPPQQIVIGTVAGTTLTPAVGFTSQESSLIENASDLAAAAQVNLSHWLASLASQLQAELRLVSHVIAADGSVRVGGVRKVQTSITKKGVAHYKTVHAKFAVADIFYIPEAGVRKKLFEITLGPVDTLAYNPDASALASIAAQIASSTVATTLPAGTQFTVGASAPSVAAGTGLTAPASAGAETATATAPAAESAPPAGGAETPTAAELAARLNPTPITVYTPQPGLFRQTGDFGSILYRELPNYDLILFDLIHDNSVLFTSQQERESYGNAGGQGAEAVKRLKAKYNIDFFALPQVNLGDYWPVAIAHWPVIPGGDVSAYARAHETVSTNIADFATQPAATLTAVQENTQAAAPAQSAVCAATTLYDFFTTLGLPLPTLAAGADMWHSLGLGDVSLYTGTADENVRLLAALKIQKGCAL